MRPTSDFVKANNKTSCDTTRKTFNESVSNVVHVIEEVFEKITESKTHQDAIVLDLSASKILEIARNFGVRPYNVENRFEVEQFMELLRAVTFQLETDLRKSGYEPKPGKGTIVLCDAYINCRHDRSRDIDTYHIIEGILIRAAYPTG